ncbi:globin [Dictyocaulus viviparus]|uniref:Globin n=1 Tax=Dictyocaulus viviparus TaxID=29172 RepID=A0A0D8XRU9_DICVI|nr:globin [Dictyocaulus viviparus]
MFTNHPDLRRYFKGAESFTAEDVQKSERFDKQGQRILLAVYILANTFDDEPTFRAYARETINRHRVYKMDPNLWLAFFTVFVNFLDSRGGVTEEQKAAWKTLGGVFNEECQSHLKDLGLPYVKQDLAYFYG